jgi:hypothetical protein
MGFTTFIAFHIKSSGFNVHLNHLEILLESRLSQQIWGGAEILHLNSPRGPLLTSDHTVLSRGPVSLVLTPSCTSESSGESKCAKSLCPARGPVVTSLKYGRRQGLQKFPGPGLSQGGVRCSVASSQLLSD